MEKVDEKRRSPRAKNKTKKKHINWTHPQTMGAAVQTPTGAIFKMKLSTYKLELTDRTLQSISLNNEY